MLAVLAWSQSLCKAQGWVEAAVCSRGGLQAAAALPRLCVSGDAVKSGPDGLRRLAPIQASGIWTWGAEAVPDHALKGS